jgi:DNA polymerase III delta subunit
MLYIFHGTDSKKSTDKARALVDSLRTKKPDASFIEISSDNWNKSIIEEHISGQGLFSQKYIVFLNKVVPVLRSLGASSVGQEGGVVVEKLVETAKLMKESENIFIINEGKVNAELKKAFEKYGDKVVVNDELEKKAFNKEFNIFSLADAMGARDRFKAWSIYREAVQNGLESESILGTIFWQIKSMILARDAKSASESGLNPFVYSKAKKGAGNYKDGELNNLLEQVIVLYHDGHRGLVDLELGIEKMMLEF